MIRGPERDGEVAARSRVPVVRSQRADMALGERLDGRALQHVFGPAVLGGAEQVTKPNLCS